MTLKDLPEGWKSPDDLFIYALRAAFGDRDGASGPTRVYRGVYEAHINFDKEISNLIVDQWPSIRYGDNYDWSQGDTFSSFGVVDHWTQLPLQLLDEPQHGNLLVYLGRHRRADQPESGGWRWHKWGPYLGVHSPETSTEYEYLYDAIDVVEVWSYCVVEVK